ncbi:MAG TPA: exopolyphosphatase [Cytophagales bacterium]|nr:exopolyphosphatase [Cytophagales bacterium]
MSKEKIGVIDLGTNTFHLLIAELNTTGFKTVFKEKTTVKIGQGGISAGFITHDAFERAITAMDNFKNIIEEYRIKRVYATATSAVRNASNGKLMVETIKARTGIEVKIIDGDQEANYIYQGVSAALNLGSDTSMIMDIGGGSVEFIICNDYEILWKKSFEIGAQRLLDKFHAQDPMPSSSRKKLYEYLEQNLKPLSKAIKEFQPKILVGCSGTFDTLCEIYNKEQGIDLDLESETECDLPIDAYLAIHEEIISKIRAERLKIPGMIELRVDMVVVASCLIKFVLQNYPISKIRVSSYALKEGILNLLVKNKQVTL